ncbi:uncharacterized protein LOC109604287 isoform X1 [Aethina tumida]|uniref:uncharacterized protein LOC109604287 isoform X1 n=1 Tax=Aethina tumida TaxID=116153 RepID=UPI00096B1571|nr:uncharacterized protein LOC109604287 isoform X1 [Aethina tumida]
MHRKTIILVTICAFLNVGDALTLDALPEMVFDVAKIILKARKIVGNYAVEGVPYPLFEKTEREMFKRFDLVNNNLEYLSRRTEAQEATTNHLISSLPRRLQLELRLNDLSDYLTRIDVNYRRMLEYAEERDHIEKATLIDFARHVVSHDPSSSINLLERIFRFLSPGRKGITDNGILHSLADSLATFELDGLVCETKNQSAQQVIYNLYNSIALTELKGYTMIQFSYMILKLYNEGNYLKESQLQQERFETRTNLAISAVKSAMQDVSRDLYRCDPKRHIKGQTYDEVTQLIQGYLQNEVDMNPYATCRENCAEYKYTKNYGCFKNLYCQKQRTCMGKILNCQFVDSDMWVCPASAYSGRRYEYIKYENGDVLGRDEGCIRGTTKVDSWWRWLFWHCSYCMCLCDEAGPQSDRFFNLRPALSNITHNKVVTGLRFIKVNRVFHMQIQEGVLKPYGKIDEDTIRWVPVSAYKITDKNVHNGIDYHQMSWEKRAVDLDDLVADKNHIVTGVKFKMIGSHLNFEIRITPFDFKNGTLIDPVNKSVWKDNPNTDSSLKNPRKRLNLYKPDIPTRSLSPSVPDSSTDQYIEFVNTDLHKDAAQTTVPFIDIQPVQSLIPGPLSGAGIFHKGRPDFGGFLAPKIITYDFSEHLKAIFPEDESPENTVLPEVEAN